MRMTVHDEGYKNAQAAGIHPRRDVNPALHLRCHEEYGPDEVCPLEGFHLPKHVIWIIEVSNGDLAGIGTKHINGLNSYVDGAYGVKILQATINPC